jgi:hypothetical protein
MYTKMLLNIIEHTPEPYERIVIIATTSESFPRWRVGKHRWAWMKPMWNMPKRGFEELYERIPGPKLSSKEVWRLTGENSEASKTLYMNKWNVEQVINVVIRSKRIHQEFVSK